MPRPSKTAAADSAGDAQPGASAGTINGVVPTPSEVKFILAFISNLKTKPEVNWEDLAATMGMSGKKSAYERWRLMRIKFGITLAEEGETPGSARKGGAAKKTAAAKAAKNNDEDDDDEETGGEPKSAPATPAKRGRKAASSATTPASAAGKKRAAAAAAGGGGGGSSPADEDMASPTKKAKGKAAAAAAAEDSSPLSSVPGMTADEDSGNEMAV
ncbi:hypothetical protein B0I37DRAFT_431829 [Chaetomium sp. MPI-CAGE-AT-0009]|nr:hypothetical protein B0I37DRAFT_431829 [Chaetomium sp. MPI-CAGE-AT-0009]